VAVGLLTVVASGSMAAAPIFLCINEKAGGGVKSGGAEGKCPLPTEKAKYAKVALPREESEQQKLLAILPYIKYVENGVGGKPTIQVSGANLQVVSGTGSTSGPVNGAGNLVIGYDEDSGQLRGHPGAQQGSNNLILGEENEFTSYGGIVASVLNNIRAPFASVLAGGENTASGVEAVVLGGVANTASWYEATVSGGARNSATGTESTVSGGDFNSANGSGSSISGGSYNVAGGGTSISGGYKNTTSGLYSSIFGGKELKATKEFEAIP
jgi:hypothetical protein